MIETYRGVVRPYQMDHMGHMNVQWYTAKFDQATWHFFAELGLTNAYFMSEDRGMAAVKQITEYKAETVAGDLLVCRTQLLEAHDRKLRFVHRMLHTQDEREVATSELLGVHLDRKARRACSFPEFVSARCQNLLKPD